MRRKVGVAAISGKKNEAAKFSEIGKELDENRITFVRDVIESFKKTLAEFASKHRQRINNDPEFRMQFHMMCSSVGVDPLSSSKGFWAELLGVGNFYFKLGVQIIKLCMKLRSINGGIMSLQELHRQIQLDPIQKDTTIEDVKRAIKSLEVLGNGFRIKNLGGTAMVVSVPLELNMDNEEIMDVAFSTASENGNNFVYVDSAMMESRRGWSQQRFDIAIDPMMKEGIVWIDRQDTNRYYFPNFGSAGTSDSFMS